MIRKNGLICCNLMNKAYASLQELEGHPVSGIIPLKKVFSKICSLFSMPKQEAWDLLRELRCKQLIDIVPFHGIRIINNKCKA